MHSTIFCTIFGKNTYKILTPKIAEQSKVWRQNNNEPTQEEERSAVFDEGFEVGLIREGFHSRPRDIGQITKIRAADVTDPDTDIA